MFNIIGKKAVCLLILVEVIPADSFLTPQQLHRNAIINQPSYITCTRLMAGSDVSNLLYQEQEKLIVKRGELEEEFVSVVKPLKATVIKVRGTGKAGGFGKVSGGSGSSNNKASSKAEGNAHAKILKKEGVLRIDNVLSADTADSVREHLYNLRYQSEKEVKEGKIQPIQRFADVLLKQNRCDLTIPLGAEIISEALEESLCKSPVGSTIASVFGDDAILHELSCLMSDSGSQRQNVHPDTPFIDGKGPVLYTCFIALQDVTLDMGPTTWFPRTHNKESHDAFMDTYESEGGGDSPKDKLIKTKPAVLGTLSKGSCAIFDSRTLHCGTANRSDLSRALFYFSFKNPNVGYPGNPASIRRELASANISLGALMEDLQSFRKGKGTPLIDRLGSQMQNKKDEEQPVEEFDSDAEDDGGDVEQRESDDCHPWTSVNPILRLRGPVASGYGRGGKKLGVPTANLPASLFSSALEDITNGVYFGWAVIEQPHSNQGGRNIPVKAVVNVGYSPTFEGEENKEKIVEAHLITKSSPMEKPSIAFDDKDGGDYQVNNDIDEIEGDFYDETMRLQLIGYLRPEQKFDAFPDLIAQIHQDIGNANEALDSMPYVFSKEEEFVKDGVDWVGSGGGDGSASWEYELW